ncbi:P-loop containing nucleoside triphosphate hydrolase protein [Pelagophyceae sp. CCMP2097]|nr:P-loop containing nucleoside triphosphate hydrolase protein [Pelagophyceae sp. CCMP2097]
MPVEEGKAGEAKAPAEAEYDGFSDSADVKVILLGDSAVGKSKLVERFMKDEYNPMQLSTYALTLFRKHVEIVDEKSGAAQKVSVDIWDTAGQERFNKVHPSYYHRAHCCILCFDVTRKTTYANLSNWYNELRDSCESIPCILVANKIDVDYQVTRKNFAFAAKKGIPLYFVSAADGTNVVKVFTAAIEAALDWKLNGDDFLEEALRLCSDSKP